MNHNKYNLVVGQIVILDKKFRNRSEVAIHAFTPNEMFATIYAKNETGNMWQVMTNRLTPIEPKIEQIEKSDVTVTSTDVDVKDFSDKVTENYNRVVPNFLRAEQPVDEDKQKSFGDYVKRLRDRLGWNKL